MYSLPGFNQPATPVYDLENDVLSVSLNGYKETCTAPVISVMTDDGAWQPTNNINFLPDMGRIYLNNEYIGHMACDLIACVPLNDPYQIRLQEYQMVGERAAPEDENLIVPAYQTNTLTGKLRVELSYFTDEACQEEQIYTVVIDNP